MKLKIVTTVIALTAGAAFAQPDDVKMPELSMPDIAFLQAAAIADKQGQGELVSMELDYIAQTTPVYLAELESDTGFARLMIDGESGDVLVSERVEALTQEAMMAYMEAFSTQAELAEMTALQELIGDGPDGGDLSEEELEELAEMMNEAEDVFLQEIGDEADLAQESDRAN